MDRRRPDRRRARPAGRRSSSACRSADGVRPTPWDAGQYRVDVLTGDGIHRISVPHPEPVRQRAATRRRGIGRRRTSSPPRRATRPASSIGLFATVDGSAVSIPARESRAARRGRRRGPTWPLRTARRSPRPYLPRATGLGVMLTSHAAVGTASHPSPRARSRWPMPPAAFGGISNMRGSDAVRRLRRRPMAASGRPASTPSPSIGRTRRVRTTAPGTSSCGPARLTTRTRLAAVRYPADMPRPSRARFRWRSSTAISAAR